MAFWKHTESMIEAFFLFSGKNGNGGESRECEFLELVFIYTVGSCSVTVIFGNSDNRFVF